MKLSVLERLLVSGLLPEKGSYTNLKLMRVAREELSFNEKDNKLLAFKQEPGPDGEMLTRWNEGVVPDAEITLGEIVTEMIKKELKALNDKEELKPEQFTLYEKFVEG